MIFNNNQALLYYIVKVLLAEKIMINNIKPWANRIKIKQIGTNDSLQSNFQIHLILFNIERLKLISSYLYYIMCVWKILTIIFLESTIYITLDLRLKIHISQNILQKTCKKRVQKYQHHLPGSANFVWNILNSKFKNEIAKINLLHV